MSDWSAFDDLNANTPGLVAGVVAGGLVKAWASFGSVSPEGEALDDCTRFYVASVAKQFTAAVVGTLWLDRRLSIEDSVRRWIPELSNSWDPVTLHHLLAHTGGLPDGHAVDAAAGWAVACEMTTWDRIAVIAASSPELSPGVAHRYSNHGYVLLAGVVERAAGERLGEFARRALFEPSGMADSRFLDADGAAAVPGWKGGKQRVDIRFSCCGDGGLVTTLRDLARWDGWLPASPLAPLMLVDRPLVSSGRVAHDAWGVSIRTHHGLRIESHGGSIDGYMASFVRFPTERSTFVVLANTDLIATQDFGRRVRQLVDSEISERLDRRKPPWTHTHGDPLDG